MLAIDCATEACSAALFEDGALLDGRYEILGRGHAERLVPMIAESSRSNPKTISSPLMSLNLQSTVRPSGVTAVPRNLMAVVNVFGGIERLPFPGNCPVPIFPRLAGQGKEEFRQSVSPSMPIRQ